MNELAQDNGNGTGGANKMKISAWLSDRALIPVAHMISRSDDIISCE